jgi:hypothetical protein
MNVFKMIEDEAHLLLQELNQHIIHQSNKGNKINEKLQEIISALDKHVNPAAPTVSTDPVPAPAVNTPAPASVDAAPVVQAPVVVATTPTTAS